MHTLLSARAHTWPAAQFPRADQILIAKVWRIHYHELFVSYSGSFCFCLVFWGGRGQTAFFYSYLVCLCIVVYSSSAVVDALKTLQEKIRRLELERTQAEKSYQQFSHDAQKHPQVTTLYSQTAASLPGTDNSARRGKRQRIESNKETGYCGSLWSGNSI